MAIERMTNGSQTGNLALVNARIFQGRRDDRALD